MASAVKKWPFFSKLAMKWPIWQPCALHSQQFVQHLTARLIDHSHVWWLGVE